MNFLLLQILLVVFYIIDPQSALQLRRVHVASENEILREKLRDFSSNLDVFRQKFESRIIEVTTSVWFSLEDFSKNESQRILEERESTVTIPFCYASYIDQLMLDLKGIFFVDVGALCVTKGNVQIARTFIMMKRYVQVIETILESIEVCHAEGSQLPTQMMIQNIFCDHSKHHLNIEIWLRELKDALSKLEQDSRKYDWVQYKICFESTAEQIERNLTDIFPVILTECENVKGYTNMLYRLSLEPLSINKFIPSITQQKIDEVHLDLDFLEDSVGLSRSDLVYEYGAMSRNGGLFRRLMIVTKSMQEVQKYLEENMVLCHSKKFEDVADVVRTMIQVEDRKGRCGANYPHSILEDLRKYYDLKLAPHCFNQIFTVSRLFQLLPKTVLNISDSLATVPMCKPEWKCDKVESQIVFIEDTLKHWEKYNMTELMANASKCFEAAREVVQGNALRNRQKMKMCLIDLELTKDMFYVLESS